MKKNMKRVLAGLCVICMMFSQGVVAFAASTQVLIESEPNNCMEDIDFYDWQINEEHDWLAIYGIVNPNDKEDWFSFTSYWNGQSDLELYIPYENINCNLYLYDQNGRCLASSKNEAGLEDEIDYVYIRKGKKYYIKVEHESGTEWVKPYELLVGVQDKHL